MMIIKKRGNFPTKNLAIQFYSANLWKDHLTSSRPFLVSSPPAVRPHGLAKVKPNGPGPCAKNTVVMADSETDPVYGEGPLHHLSG